jgi:hypothetical protein
MLKHHGKKLIKNYVIVNCKNQAKQLIITIPKGIAQKKNIKKGTILFFCFNELDNRINPDRLEIIIKKDGVDKNGND